MELSLCAILAASTYKSHMERLLPPAIDTYALAQINNNNNQEIVELLGCHTNFHWK
jgi:hypothetical protein